MRFFLLMIAMVFFLACEKEDVMPETEVIPEPEPVEETLPDPEGTQYATWLMIWNRSSEH